jgi:hypothetical protein
MGGEESYINDCGDVGFMKRISVVISNEAWQVLKEYQERTKIGTRDEALEKLLTTWRPLEEA